MLMNENLNSSLTKEEVVINLVDIYIDFTKLSGNDDENILEESTEELGESYYHGIYKLTHLIANYCNVPEIAEDRKSETKARIKWIMWFSDTINKFIFREEPIPRNELAAFFLSWNDSKMQRQIGSKYPAFIRQ